MFNPGESRDFHGRWNQGISKVTAALDWLKSGEAKAAVIAAVKSPHLQKEAVALGIKSALYHLGNVDDPAMEIMEPYIHEAVHNAGMHLRVSSARARAMMQASVAKMIAARKAAQ